MRVPFNADGTTVFQSPFHVLAQFETKTGLSELLGMAGGLTILFSHFQFS